MIWHKALNLQEINKFNSKCMVGDLEIEITGSSEDELIGKMPVTSRVHQPFGILHGGASCVLAESLGSVASNLCIDPEKFYCVGLEINANHIRPVREGYVYATAKNIHLGKTTHIWEIKIHDENKKLVCISRLTMAVVEKK